jgi:hypothetical protein
LEGVSGYACRSLLPTEFLEEPNNNASWMSGASNSKFMICVIRAVNFEHRLAHDAAALRYRPIRSGEQLGAER